MQEPFRLKQGTWAILRKERGVMKYLQSRVPGNAKAFITIEVQKRQRVCIASFVKDILLKGGVLRGDRLLPCCSPGGLRVADLLPAAPLMRLAIGRPSFPSAAHSRQAIGAHSRQANKQLADSNSYQLRLSNFSAPL